MRTTERAARIACLRLKDHLRETGELTAADIVQIAAHAADESERVQRVLLDAGREPDRVVIV